MLTSDNIVTASLLLKKTESTTMLGGLSLILTSACYVHVHNITMLMINQCSVYCHHQLSFACMPTFDNYKKHKVQQRLMGMSVLLAFGNKTTLDERLRDH